MSRHAIALSLLWAAAAQAQPSSEPLLNADGRNAAYTGIGRLFLSSNCTAFLLRTPGGAAAPAYALSAAHCYSFDAQAVVVNAAPPANMRPVVFHLFADTVSRQVAVPVQRIAYATMKARDLLLLELAATQGEMAERGITALELASEEPAAGDAVSVVGAPTSFFDSSAWFLRRSTCRVGARVDLIEFNWHFRDTRRNDCEDIVGGISGSPLIVERTGRVAGVVHTTTHLAVNRGGDFDCYLGIPCELTPAGPPRVVDEMSYSVPVADMAGCFAPATGEFSLTQPGCRLDPGGASRLTVSGVRRVQQPGGRWNAALTGTPATYRYKVVRASTNDDCRMPAGYSPPLARAERPAIDDPLPAEEGVYLLCVLPEGTPARDATALVARIDATPPVLLPEYSISPESRLTFGFVPPELSGYDYKFGPPGSTRCDDSQGYRPYLRVPITLPQSQYPLRVCFYGYDLANNATPALDFVVGAGPVIFPTGITHAAGFRAQGLAPGQWISIYGQDLQAGDITLTDAQGARHVLPPVYRGSTQINLRLPDRLAPGEAALRVGESPAEPVWVVDASPGIFFDPVIAGGVVQIYASGLAGIAPERVTVRVGRLTLRAATLQSTAAGVEFVRAVLPEGHGLSGRQLVRLSVDALASNWRFATMLSAQ